jgi:hypothetical protein
MRFAPFAGHDQGSKKYKWVTRNAMKKSELKSFFGYLDDLSVDDKLKDKKLSGPQDMVTATRSGKYGKSYVMGEKGKLQDEIIGGISAKEVENINKYAKGRISFLKNKQAMPGLSQVR